MASLSPAYRSEEVLNRIQARLIDLCQKQQALATSRRDLLLRREGTRSSGAVVQSKQLEARDVEAALMSSMRQFYHQYLGSLPVPLKLLYEKLEGLRDGMSIIQDDHEEAQRGLTGREWAFADQEEEVYQYQIEDLLEEFANLRKLASNKPSDALQSNSSSTAYPCLNTAAWLSTISSQARPPPPPPPPFPMPHAVSSKANTRAPTLSQRSLRTVTTKLATLRREFDALRSARASRTAACNKTGNANEEERFKDEYFDVIDRLVKHEVQVQKLRDEEAQSRIAESAFTRRHSYDGLPSPRSKEFVSQEARARTESAFPPSRDKVLPDVRTRSWLFENLESIPLQRTLYRNVLEDFSITSQNDNEYQLIDRAARFWDIDSHMSDLDHVDMAAATMCVWNPELDEEEKWDISITDDEASVARIDDSQHGLSEWEGVSTASPPSSEWEVPRPDEKDGTPTQRAMDARMIPDETAATFGVATSSDAVGTEPSDIEASLGLPISPSRVDSCHGLAEMGLSANTENVRPIHEPSEEPRLHSSKATMAEVKCDGRPTLRRPDSGISLPGHHAEDSDVATAERSASKLEDLEHSSLRATCGAYSVLGKHTQLSFNQSREHCAIDPLLVTSRARGAHIACVRSVHIIPI
jgi:hypothetical protein